MIALLAILSTFALTGGGSDTPYTQTVQRSVPQAAGGEVEIDDDYGDVRVTAGSAGTVEIVAVKKAASQDDLASMDVHVDAIEGAVKVSTDFPSSWHGMHHDRVQHSVDYSINVPKNTKVILRLKYGEGTITDVEGAVDAASRYGDLKVTGASGEDSLSTEYGDVALSVNAIEASQHVTMHTAYGDVDLTLPAGAAPHIAAVTRFGDIDDDFESASAAGPSVDLKTTFGDVVVRKAPS